VQLRAHLQAPATAASLHRQGHGAGAGCPADARRQAGCLQRLSRPRLKVTIVCERWDEGIDQELARHGLGAILQ
jgi:hypothetical protein